MQHETLGAQQQHQQSFLLTPFLRMMLTVMMMLINLFHALSVVSFLPSVMKSWKLRGAIEIHALFQVLNSENSAIMAGLTDV
uniref:Transmembrane protein n=1 Tax=Panagrellus redivivus TaxID=6233 RepID=A0A7E4W1X9_PANRE